MIYATLSQFSRFPRSNNSTINAFTVIYNEWGGDSSIVVYLPTKHQPDKKISAPHRNRFNNTIQKERWIFLPALSDVATFRNWILVWISSKCLSRDIFNERKLTKAFDWYQFISCNCSKSIQTKRWNESVCKIGSNNFQVGINTYRHFHHFPSLIALYFRRCRLFLPKSLCSQTFGDHYRIRINCKKKNWNVRL